MKTFTTQTISTKGQVVIPAPYRKFLGIIPQGKLIMEIVVPERKIIISPLKDPIEELRGVLKSKGKTAASLKKTIRKEEAYYEKKHS